MPAPTVDKIDMTSTKWSHWFKMTLAFVAVLLLFCVALKLYCGCSSEVEQNEEGGVAVRQVGLLYMQFDTVTYKLFLNVFSSLDQDEEVEGALRALDDSLASGSNTTSLHSDTLTECSWMTQIPGLILVISLVSCVRSFQSSTFYEEGRNKARNGHYDSIRLLKIILPLLLISCLSTEISARGISDIELSETNRDSLNSTSQDLIAYYCPSSQESLNRSTTSAEAFSLGSAKSFAEKKAEVKKVSAMTRLMKQLDMAAPDAVPIQNIKLRKQTSGMYAMMKFYSSKKRTHRVKLEVHDRQSRTHLPRIKLTLWIACVVIAFLLLIIIPYIHPFLCSHGTHAPFYEKTPACTYQTVYLSGQSTRLSSEYMNKCAPGVNGSSKSYSASYWSNHSTGIGFAVSQTDHGGRVEEEKSESYHSDNYARQSSDAGGGSCELVGIRFHRPMSTGNKRDEDSVDAPIVVYELPQAADYPVHEDITSGAPVLFGKTAYQGFSSLQEMR